MKTIKAKVHRLATDDYTSIVVSNKGELEYTYGEQVNGYQKHLYITTDEEIKEGDWFYYNHNGGVIGQYKKGMGEVDGKIIATTDPKILGKSKITETKNVIRHSVFPSIPQSFIEEYCKAGGIDEVLVECKRIPHFDIEYSHNGLRTEKFNGVTYEDTNEPKLNPDNTIIIHPVEEKMYSLDNLRNAYDVGRNYQRTGDIDLHFDNWIKSIL